MLYTSYQPNIYSQNPLINTYYRKTVKFILTRGKKESTTQSQKS